MIRWAQMKKVPVSLALLVLLSPLLLSLCCFANPMLLGFLEPVGITNRSMEELRAIPLGRGEPGRPHAPPLYWSRLPVALPRGNDTFIVPAGGSTTFIYDWDDINLCWLLVRSASSNWKVIPSSLKGPSCALSPVTDGGCCRGLGEGFAFEIDDVATLAEAPSWLVAAACPDGGGC
ncbi:MAG: hypothetical protein Q8L48_10535 [Archangium sp.]|nr:hypothetical protein [Archangium sp.]